MVKRALAVTVFALILCFTATPAWALAFCPALQHQAQHPCCPAHHKQPAPLCSVHCRSAQATPPQSVSVEMPSGIQAFGTLPVPLHTADVAGETAIFDSSGLWLRDRVLRI